MGFGCDRTTAPAASRAAARNLCAIMVEIGGSGSGKRKAAELLTAPTEGARWAPSDGRTDFRAT
ncbi:MAG: hypothetical protein ACRDQ5_08015, partial [Sciscionella sp.]